MGLLLLDTTFLIDAERDGVELDSAIDDDDDVAIAAITVAELLMGVRLASPRRRKTRQVYVDDIIESRSKTPISLSPFATKTDHAAPTTY